MTLNISPIYQRVCPVCPHDKQRLPRNSELSCGGLLLLVVIDADEVAGRSEGRPGDVEPTGAGEELVGKDLGFQERDQSLKLVGGFGADVGSAALKVLGVLDTANEYTVEPTPLCKNIPEICESLGDCYYLIIWSNLTGFMRMSQMASM